MREQMGMVWFAVEPSSRGDLLFSLFERISVWINKQFWVHLPIKLIELKMFLRSINAYSRTVYDTIDLCVSETVS